VSTSGGEGADRIIGGAGRDRYLYASASDSIAGQSDTVRFNRKDHFDFKAFDADTTQEGRQMFSFIGKSTFSGVAGELRATRSVLEADLNGDSVADFAINLIGDKSLNASNLIF
jgi:hypothetical protein